MIVTKYQQNILRYPASYNESKLSAKIAINYNGYLNPMEENWRYNSSLRVAGSTAGACFPKINGYMPYLLSGTSRFALISSREKIGLRREKKRKEFKETRGIQSNFNCPSHLLDSNFRTSVIFRVQKSNREMIALSFSKAVTKIKNAIFIVLTN